MTTPDADPSTRLPDTADRLESWKEIARYLDRQVRTVQRWEKSEGLPIHRHQHQSGGSVFARRAELDQWRSHRTLHQAQEQTPSQGNGDGKGLSRRAALILAAVVLLPVSFWLLPTDSPSPTRTRLVVLPFLASGNSPVSEAMQDGLTEELITRLATLAPDRLAVIGRTSSMCYKQRQRSIAEIGSELDVAHVVEGAVSIVGSRIRINMRLLRAQQQDQLWAQSVDLDDGDFFAAQQEAANVLANAVSAHILNLPPRNQPTQPRLAAARENYLQGRYLWNKGTGDGFVRSIPFFEEALAKEPDYIEAQVSLAHAHNLLGRFGILAPKETFPLGRMAAERALELAPHNGEAQAAMALVSFYWDWDFARADTEFQQAIQESSGLALAHHWYAHFLSAMGRHEEAIAEVSIAQSLEPLWPLVNADAAWFYFRARRFEEALVQCRRSLEIEPRFGSAAYCLVSCLQRLGRSAEAWTEMRSYLQVQGTLDQIEGLVEKDPSASIDAVHRWRLKTLQELPEGTYVPPYSYAFIHASLDQKDQAFEWLAQAIEVRDRSALLLKVHPAFDCLREDPRHVEMLIKIGLESRGGSPAGPARRNTRCGSCSDQGITSFSLRAVVRAKGDAAQKLESLGDGHFRARWPGPAFVLYNRWDELVPQTQPVV